MTDRAIVFGITADIAFAAGALLASILAQDRGFDADVVILHDGLTEGQMGAFLTLWPRCRFRRFTTADVEGRLGVPVTSPKVKAYFAHLTPMVLAKLELPDLLDDYERVVWLDADMLVRGPLATLWDFDCLAWRPLPPGAFARRARVLAPFADRGLDPAVPLLNGGVIGVARAFRTKGGSRAALHDIARDLILRAPPTQLAEMPWYLLAALKGLQVTPYPMRLNHSVAAPGVAEATIVHAIGPHKFWNAAPLQQLYPDWARHQADWVSAGGLPYAGPVLLTEAHPAEPSEVIRSAEARAFWLALFPRLRPMLPPGMLADLRHDRPFLTLFLHGRPEDQQLRLVRMPNPGRLGVSLHLPDDLADVALAAIARAVPAARAEKGAMLSMPVSQIGLALAAVADSLPKG